MGDPRRVVCPLRGLLTEGPPPYRVFLGDGDDRFAMRFATEEAKQEPFDSLNGADILRLLDRDLDGAACGPGQDQVDLDVRDAFGPRARCERIKRCRLPSPRWTPSATT